MDIRLQKRLNETNDRLFYTVYNQAKDEYYDLFEFKRFKEVPIVEREIFKIFLNCFSSVFTKNEYKYPYFKANLLVLHGIQFEELENYKIISYKVCNLLKDVYIQLRWKELYNLANSFKAKLTPEGVENLKNYILDMKLKDFSDDLKSKFREFESEISFKGKEEDLFKECLTLSIYDEYQKGLVKTQNKQKKIKKAMDEDDIDEAIRILQEEN